jgi:hypothetical protein
MTSSTKRERKGRGSCIRGPPMMRKRHKKGRGSTRMGTARTGKNPRLRRRTRRRGVKIDRRRGKKMCD